MKILYLNFVPSYELGVLKKMEFQKKSLEKYGINVFSTSIKKDTFYFDNDKIFVFKEGKNIKNKILRKLQQILILKKIVNLIKINKINVLYFRYELTEIQHLYFFRYLKKILDLKIIIEIPTYPYDKEYTKLSYKILSDKILRKYNKKYVDRIVTFSSDNEIFGIKTIKINNGIDINQISIINRLKKQENSEINFITVARIAFWHGIDRFILSMAEYYKTNPKEIIKFHIIGDGGKEIVKELKKLVKDNNLEDYVIFYGYKSGKELDNIYNQIDIAIGSLGIHRLKLEEVQPLKNREYCAKGLPFIISFRDPCFDNKEFVYKVSDDENLFDIKDAIKWYKNLKILPEEIREYSKQFTWDIQVGKVVEYLEDKN